MIIQILVDNPISWFNKYTNKLVEQLIKLGHETSLVRDYRDLKKGDIVFILSCNKIVPNNVLKLNKHNFVIHAADLPRGRGWSPCTWQILEGKNTIPLSMFDAHEKVDSGLIYMKDQIHLNGTELIEEWREVLGNKINEMVHNFLKDYPKAIGKRQDGECSYYRKRTKNDSELDIDKSIKNQFNLLRVVDNEQYPAFFIYNGKKYIIKINREVS
jgi:methionyl-tRNA formyltransferase